MEILKIKNTRLLKFFLTIISSFFLFFSFRQLFLFSEENLIFFLLYLIFQFIIFLFIFFKNYLLINLFILINLNLFLTPVFFNYTFDVPYRAPNKTIEVNWKKDLKKGFEIEKHFSTTDSRGNRVNKNIDYEKKEKNTYRIFAIGASTTELEGLDDKLIWSNLVVEKLKKTEMLKKNNYEIINFGVAGLRSMHHYYTLKRNLSSKPDLAIFLLGVNDWNYHIVNRNKKILVPILEIPFNFKNSLFFKFSVKIKRLSSKKKFQHNLNLNQKKNLENPYKSLINENIMIKNNIKDFTTVDIKNVSDTYKFWLNKIIKVCKSKNLDCIFLDQPSLYNLEQEKINQNKLWMNPPFEDYKVNFSDLVRIQNVYNSHLKKNTINSGQYFCNLSEKIKSNDNNFLDDVHFTPRGSKMVASILFECIKNQID